MSNPRMHVDVLPAGLDDIATYTALARDAQVWLRSRGLEQYVPAAHDEYADAIRSRAASGTMFAVQDEGEAIGYFSFEDSPSPWWSADRTLAMYLAGMVVARSARGREIGSFIIDWCIAEAARLDRKCVRLDCHAGNPWLCRYYEAHGFQLQGQVEQHPGYFGRLYQIDLDSAVGWNGSSVRRH